MSPRHELFHVEYEYSLQNIQSVYMRMGSAIHIKRFYDTEGILHREKLMMVNSLSVKVKALNHCLCRELCFLVFTLYKSHWIGIRSQHDLLKQYLENCILEIKKLISLHSLMPDRFIRWKRRCCLWANQNAVT